jgi:antitoxin ChpS
MELQLRKLGNSTGLTLPPSLMRDLGLAAGQRMTLSKMPDGALLLTPKIERRKYSAADLNAQCNLKAPMPADLVAWEQLPPVGNEAL